MRFAACFTAIAALQTASCLASRMAYAGDGDDGLTVQTCYGEVHGFVNSTAPDVRQFLGVPFAKPPVGDLRFAPPQSPDDNGESINATGFPPSCMQQFSNSTTIYTAKVSEFLINGGQSEDCLYVSIWTPALKSIQQQELPLPVFVYIPGGGFTSGGQNSLYKIPDKWVQRTQSHIVVIMNYRVNVFGFPNARGLEDQNVGLLDQRKAVEWVRDNIAGFGGDPEKIVLWGQSAGGNSVALFSYAYPKDPIVKGLLADSGSSTTLNNQDFAHSNFTFLAGLVGCGGLDPAPELACVRNIPAVTLENALSNYQISGRKPSISFVPLPDNKTAFYNTSDRIQQGLVAKIPLITGSNTNEGAGFVPYTPEGPGQQALRASTQNIIACPIGREVANRVRAGLPVYRYQYDGNFTNVSPVSWFGAYHSSELPLLFGTHYEYRGDSTTFEYKVSHAMEALWLSFAQNPSRGPVYWPSSSQEGTSDKAASIFEWPQYSPDSATMVLFASGDQTTQLVSGDRIDGNCTGI